MKQLGSPVHQRLKEAREAKGLSQKELGILAGIDPSSASSRMNHYEKGRHVPDINMLRQLARVLNVPLPYFYCESELMADCVKAMGTLSESELKHHLGSFLK